jgi:NADH-quinone oxidoreductase subunit G
MDLSPAAGRPVSAAIYQLDGIVRRAPSLQSTADARAGVSAQVQGVTA